MKTLHLTLKKKYFDQTKAKIKREEYRELKWYWASRLLYRIELPNTIGGYLSAWSDIVDGDYSFEGWKKMSHGAPVFREFEKVFARNGYSKDAPTLTEQVESISIGEGRPEWGAEPGKLYFVIRYKD